MKKIVQGKEHFEKVCAGVDLVADIVGKTMGPCGQNVICDRGFSVPILTNDGVTIARAIESSCDIERQGIESINHCAKTTNTDAGDGTSTTIVLARAIVHEGLKCSENPMDIKRSLDEASIKVVSEIKKVSRPLRGDELLQVATISAENKEIGQIIVDTLDAIGKDGIISVEESKGQYVESKIVEGYEMPKGFVSPFMINRDGNKSEYLNCKVLVVGDKLSTVAEILPFFQKVSEATKDLVIFCPDIDPIVTATFVHNKQTGMFNTLVVQIPSLKDEVLEDIAIVTGAKFVSKASGFDFATLEPSCLGSAERVTATHAKTIIINGGGSVKKKTKDLKTHLATITDDNEYDLCEKRIARLNGGVAVISVGAKTEQEMRYLFYKVEDAVNATRAAIEEGIVEGGGMTLYRISQKLGDTVGDRILAKALRVPLRYILENGGLDYTEVLLNMPKGKGFNAHTREYENLIETGVIDPAKVERCCVENAVSFAGPFLTSFATVALDRSGKDKLE